MHIAYSFIPTSARSQGRSSLAGIGMMLAASTILAGLIYRTFSVSMSPQWVELTRQMGLVFVAAEAAIIMYAREKGFRPTQYWRGADAPVKIALITFLPIFWISSVFVSPQPLFSTFLSLTWVVHLIFALAVHSLIGRIERRDIVGFALCLISGFALFLPLIALHFSFPPPARYSGFPPPGAVRSEWLDWGSAIPGFISVRLFGAYAAAMSALALGVAWAFDPRGRDGWIIYGLSTLCLAAVIWSGTRAAVLGLAVAAIIAYAVTRRRPPKRLICSLPVCLAVATVVASLLMPEGDSRFLLVAAGDGANANAATGGRLSYWTLLWRAFLEEPILGGGSGSTLWRVEINGERHVQPHNVVLQFLLSWGVAGALPALFLLGVATWRTHVIIRRHSWLLPIILMLDCLLAISLFDGMLYFARFVMLIMAAYAICFAAPGLRGRRRD